MSIQVDRPSNHFHVPTTWNQDAGSKIDTSELQHAVQLLQQVMQQVQAHKLFGNMLNQPEFGNSGQGHGGGQGGGHHGGSTGFGENGRFGSPYAKPPAQPDIELPANKPNPGKHNTSAPTTGTTPTAASPKPDTSPTSKPDTSPTSTPSTEGKVTYGVKPPEPTGVVDVNKPIVVKAGETFDGGGKYYRPTKAMGDNSQNEHQQAVFILEPGAKLKNVQYSGADGIHLLGDAKLDRVVNRQVGEDAITIDGPKNRAHDAKIAGIDPNSIPNRPANVEITNSAFYGGRDKIIQGNASANVKLDGVYVNGAGKVFRTNGGDTQMNTHVAIQNSTFLNVAEAVFRSDSKSSSVSFLNVNSDAPDYALVPDASQVTGTNKVSYKAYSG
ncbi:pectate lyase [Ralstonia solanacearum P673]|uniref:pectate lyase n=1 Tax=Ralstonia solanacearum TaxID=305 RepID=UPI000452229F|nr:pectate lyase [Ralstonia solanacearum]EUJ15898.1 HARPIN [Ralstonia solanacearum P673]MCL9847913.1 pectate lyase [Ralstonia solanacearum]MCL9852598.1 pectate lyase [Ralstonia solanacearum]MCL9859745.1 pectate lyase [Ralstonia solanacearum]MCL9862008.1 pectate lyase [Ralstonia solanacearum]